MNAHLFIGSAAGAFFGALLAGPLGAAVGAAIGAGAVRWLSPSAPPPRTPVSTMHGAHGAHGAPPPPVRAPRPALTTSSAPNEDDWFHKRVGDAERWER